jgi:hypothetical protein
LAGESRITTICDMKLECVSLDDNPMTSEKRLQTRFILGAALELVGIVVIAAALGADLGGAAAIVAGGALIAIGAALQVSWFLAARRAHTNEEP